jgi:hypothetical protein
VKHIYKPFAIVKLTDDINDDRLAGNEAIIISATNDFIFPEHGYRINVFIDNKLTKWIVFDNMIEKLL